MPLIAQATFSTTGAPDADADYIEIVAPSNMYAVSIEDISISFRGRRV